MRLQKSKYLCALLMCTTLSSVAPASAQGLDITVSEDVIVVQGSRIPDEKRATSEISNVLSQEKLERSGDSDIAAALRRVTGLSLSQGKFVVVRGLNGAILKPHTQWVSITIARAIAPGCATRLVSNFNCRQRASSKNLLTRIFR